METVPGLQMLFERRQSLRRFIFVFARYENNRRLPRWLGGSGCLNRKAHERQNARREDGGFFHGFS